MIATPQPRPNGGLKLPPFPTRELVIVNPNPTPVKADLTGGEAESMKTSIYAQLDEFEGYVTRCCYYDAD